MRSKDSYYSELEVLNSAFKIMDSQRLESVSLLNKFLDSKKFQEGSELDDCLVGLIVYFANKTSQKPLTLTEIARITNVEQLCFRKQLKIVNRVLGLGYIPLDSSKYIYRFCSELKLSPMTVTKALDIIEKYKLVEPNAMTSPLTLTASAIYISALMNGEKRNQREVGYVVGVSEVGLRNLVRRIYDSVDFDKGDVL